MPKTETFQSIADRVLGPDATYDWAMPQEWFNQASEISGHNPSGHVVWLYDRQSRIFGRPFGLTDLGKQIVEDMSK
jgi:hypothetical protein